MKKEKVLVAMSGGVDSSVAAALLLKGGYEPIGVTMRLWDQPETAEKRRGCCSLDDVNDARMVADQLGIPHYTLNMRDEFRANVVDYFVGEYLAGRTPNPCIACNRVMKFDLLLKKARQLDAQKLATGHYARISKTGGVYSLLRGADSSKDQSYFLFDVPQQTLADVLFPVGDMTKENVRKTAERLGLKTAEKAESQEICFVPDDDYEKFIRSMAPDVKEGEFVNRLGEKIGTHKGVPFYTVGQRRRLGVSAGERMYVTAIRPESNAVVLGAEAELWTDLMVVQNPIFRRPVEDGNSADVQVRYRSAPVRAAIKLLGENRAELKFEKPVRAVAPGQAAVFYEGDAVVGGGWITGTRTADEHG
ncbi:MAG: tRNA 2-thiouridine(34) synthase MnmA [Nitrospinae bacterium]|nr:tRNA 2-thiouridine(34) synthase MnmA [Nitrospinota bacterium]